MDEALTGWPRPTRQAAELVKLRYFAGLTLEQAAAVLGISPRHGRHVWAFARAWLFRALGGDSSAKALTARLSDFLVQSRHAHVALARWTRPTGTDS